MSPKKAGEHQKAKTTRAEEAEHCVNVLVTGFGSFPRYRKTNPSYAIAQTLPSNLPATPTRPQIRITAHPEPVPVVYSEVDRLIPELYSGKTRYDFVIHTGVDTRSAQYSLETAARCRGYAEPGADGRAGLVKGAHPVYGEDAPDVLRTTARVDEVMARWEGMVPKRVDLRLSDDAGLYLCEYICYGSLCYFHQRNDRGSTVVFVHVPSANDEAAIETGSKVLVALIQALVDSEAIVASA